MRFFRRLFRESDAVSAVETAIALPICIYAFFMLMEICLSLYAATLIKTTAQNTLSFVQSHAAMSAFYAPDAEFNSSDVASTAGRFTEAFFAQDSLNLVGNAPPNTCVSWWQPGTTVGPYRYQDCTGGSGEGSYSWGNGDPGSPQVGQEVAVQVTWRYQPWLSHLFPTPSTFSYTAVGPVLY